MINKKNTLNNRKVENNTRQKREKEVKKNLNNNGDRQANSLTKNINLKLIGIIISIIIFLSILSYFNFQKDNVVISSQTYDLIRSSKDNHNYDNLVEKEYRFNSQIILNPLLKILNSNNTLNLLMVLIFIVSLVIINKITNKDSLILLLLPFSPIFIQSFFIINDYTFSMFFALLSMFFINKKIFISLIMIVFSLFFNTIIGVLVVIFILMLIIKKNKEYKILSKLQVLIWLIPIIGAFTLNKNTLFTLSQYFVELNTIYGISMIMILISLIGYNKFKKNNLIWITIWSALILMAVDSVACLLILNIVLLYTTAKTLKVIINELWNDISLKKLTILLLFCTIIFSSLIYTSFIDKNQTNSNVVDSLKTIKNSNVGTILSSNQNGYMLKFFTNKSVLLDSEIINIKDGNIKQDDSITIFSSRNFQTTSTLVNKYNISHIVLTKDMINPKVETNMYDGLLFLIDVYKDNFEIIEKNEYISIYEFRN